MKISLQATTKQNIHNIVSIILLVIVFIGALYYVSPSVRWLDFLNNNNDKLTSYVQKLPQTIDKNVVIENVKAHSIKEEQMTSRIHQHLFELKSFILVSAIVIFINIMTSYVKIEVRS